MNGEASTLETDPDSATESGADGAESDADGAESEAEAGSGPAAAGYLVDVKRSARKASAEAGQWVGDNGTRRRFDSKPQARSWTRDLTRDGDRTVWVQDAHPRDDTVDGYVVARRWDPERSRAREQTAATAQTSLDAH